MYMLMTLRVNILTPIQYNIYKLDLYCQNEQYKLEYVGPGDNTPSLDQPHHFVLFLNVTPETWYVTRDPWHLTPDMWHVVGG